ncbi:MAG TPA: trypsin-like peptidase domain-containing protein [Mycobacteriales bacterium]|nr:trypsin-like peptidase domain-containing protein [Mycobacteriales bacterium]
MSDDLFWPRQRDENEPDPRGGDPGWHATQPIDRPEADAAAAPAAASPSGRSWRTTAVAAGLAALVFGGAGVGVGAAIEGGGSGGSGSDTVSGLNVSPTSNQSAPINPRSYAGIAAKVLPSVVSINVSGSSEQDTGSGVVIRPDGYILTNNHVVSAAVGGGKVAVVFNDGSTAPARIVGTDQEDDLAVLKVAKTGLSAATLGSSAAVRVGDPVLAVGSPLGLTGTVTAGIVSALNRPVDTTDDQQQNANPFAPPQRVTTTVISAIQTDAAINPGNSGGPLVNARGQVIGINSAIASTGGGLGGQPGNIGVGFAIPIDQARVIAQELIDNGKVSHPLLGVSLADATDSSGKQLARVQSLLRGGPAARAGIQVGDIIVAVGGQSTSGSDAVIAAIRTHQPGDRVPVTVERNGVRKTVTVTLIDAASAQS